LRHSIDYLDIAINAKTFARMRFGLQYKSNGDTVMQKVLLNSTAYFLRIKRLL